MWLKLWIMGSGHFRLEPFIGMSLFDVHIHVGTGSTFLGTMRAIVELQSRVYGHMLLQIALLLKALLTIRTLQICGQFMGIFDMGT